MALTLEQKLKIFRQLQQFCIFHTIAVLMKNHGGKSQENVMTPQELKMVCEKSNKKIGEKNCFVFDVEKNVCL